MGFLDFLFDKEKSAERTLQKLEKKLTNMYVQAPERQYAVQELRELGHSEAVWVLLQRYNENNPNTTVDIEEKELVFSTLVGMSRDADADVVGQIKRYVTEKEVKINWPMKALHAILPEDKYVEFIVETLQSCDTIFQRTTEKKQELMLRAMDVSSPELARELGRFLSDTDETIRFLAFDAALAQGHGEEISEAFWTQLLVEDSSRITQKVMPELTTYQDLVVPDELKEDVEAFLPQGLGIHKEGYIYRRRR